MNKPHRFLVSVLLIGAYLLSACSGAVPGGAVRQNSSSDGAAEAQYTEVVFTGSVEAMDIVQWTISGQVISVEGASIDAGIQVGDIVKVEAKVAADGSILALKIEAADNANDNMNGNVNDNANDNANMNGNVNDNANMNDNDNDNDNANMNGNVNDNANMNDNDNDNDNANMNGNDNDDNANGNLNGNDNSAPAGVEREVFGIVEAISTQSVTVSGVTYSLASFTEFKTIIAVGDQVKLHVIAASDGSLVVREIERTTRTGDDNNGNSNSNSNHNSNSNGNHNDNDDDDDNDNDNNNGNSNGDD